MFYTGYYTTIGSKVQIEKQLDKLSVYKKQSINIQINERRTNYFI